MLAEERAENMVRFGFQDFRRPKAVRVRLVCGRLCIMLPEVKPALIKLLWLALHSQTDNGKRHYTQRSITA